MDISVRVLSRDDLSAFRAIRLQGIQESPGAFLQTEKEFLAIAPSDLEKWIESSEERAVVGAFQEDGALIAIAGFKRDAGAKKRHQALVWGVYVAAKVRGLGIGKLVMRILIDEAKKRQELYQLYLSVTETQGPALNMYRRLGFELYGKEPRAVRVGDVFLDEDLMMLDLQS